MSHQDSFNSTCAILGCTTKEFYAVYESEAPEFDTDTLSQQILTNVIPVRRTCLNAANSEYSLEKLLTAMLEYAPHTLGRRYVAVTLYIANSKGQDVVIDVVRAWVENIFLPIIELFKAKINGDLTPAMEEDPLKQKLSIREQHHCAITQTLDIAFVYELINQKRTQEIPGGVRQSPMKATQIIPPSLGEFNDNTEAKPGFLDMVWSWTQIEIERIKRMIGTPRNAIYMTTAEDRSFRRFLFYLDGTLYPNKYMLRVLGNFFTLSNGKRSAEVEFRPSTDSGFDPPDPNLIKVHAAIAKVLGLSGVRRYFERIELLDTEDSALLVENESNFVSFLTSKLSLIAR
ncbi:hypothetical protein BDN72DRAFT_900316 [Pluteus cervinus]|uniref:Uncharacterized protein n=1 Tax=Pluteus cervinus TaxID=181527 RepID=A0ACD3AJF3_9AGAR|nr:hypothetical protein BDN72DRAFT_900316 [Pluteus cervinus]